MTKDERRRQAAKRRLDMGPVAGGSGLAKKSRSNASQAGVDPTADQPAATPPVAVPTTHKPENPNKRRKNSLLWKYFTISDSAKRWSEKKGIWHYDAICQVVTKIGEKDVVCKAFIGRKTLKDRIARNANTSPMR
jgi:hypothetical protein